MTDRVTRRRFLHQTFAFSAMAALTGCGDQIATVTPAPSVPQPSPATLHLLAVGDWGAERNVAAQAKVAAAMQTYVAQQRISADAVLMLGDNFYGSLTGGAGSARWKSQFEEMYPASVFNCPFYGALGNHDYQVEPVDKVEAELAYATQGTSRWQMPARYYEVSLPAKAPIVTILVLDSNRPDEPAQPPPFDPTYFTPTHAEVAVQQKWMQKTLEQPRATPFLMIAAHHPLYSNGAHGDNHSLISTVDPLLRRHAPQFYFAGHDHDMQHLEFAGHPTSFVLAGGGGAELGRMDGEDPARGPYGKEVHGFTHVAMTATMSTVRLIDDQGAVLHAFQKAPDGATTLLR